MRISDWSSDVCSSDLPTRSLATITFKDTPAELMGPAGKGWAQLSRVFDGAAVLFAFEQVGGSEAAIEMARDYSLERSEERRVGKACVSKCRSRWSPYH